MISVTLKSLNSKSRVSSKWLRNVAVKFDVVFLYIETC